MPTEDPTTTASAGTPLPEPPPVLTVEELAAMLRIERKTAYAAIRRGEIPGTRRIGGVIRISRERCYGAERRPAGGGVPWNCSVLSGT
jgi:excisionase family DNA binding protein